MFTGIVEEKGIVGGLRREHGRAASMSIRAKRVIEGTGIGDSIMVSGVCLTVIDLTDDGFSVEVSPETLGRSILGDLGIGSPVNLERALRAGDRLGGHIVNGHVDAVGRITARRIEGNSVIFAVEIPPEIRRYAVEKGSIAVDGISLTIAEAGERDLKVSIIPHTLEATTLAQARPGTRVNLEVDVLAKYVESMLRPGTSATGIEEALNRGGFTSPEET